MALYGLNGTLIQSSKGNNIELAECADGFYILKVITEDGVISKVIKKK